MKSLCVTGGYTAEASRQWTTHGANGTIAW
jgi:hypothetical protein